MNLRLQRVVVEEFLSGLRGRELLYLPNPGNAGDALIAAGTRMAFLRAGLSPEVIDENANVCGKTVILGGGGSLIGVGGGFPAALRRFSSEAKEIIILPHTIKNIEEIIENLSENVTIFAREIKTFLYLSNHCHRPTILLSHDMAFHLNANEFLRDRRVAEAGERWFSAMLKHHGINFANIASAQRAYFARTDWEKKASIGHADFDVSAVFGFGIWGERGSAAAWCLLNAVREVRAVATDRLHIGIASALLGKNCYLYDNIYGKNSSVFEYSIKYQFRNVDLRTH